MKTKMLSDFGVKLADITCLERGCVDLTVCSVGDILISCFGEIFIYLKHNNGSSYPHDLEYYNREGEYGSRCDNGRVMSLNNLDSDHDIVKIISIREQKLLKILK